MASSPSGPSPRSLHLFVWSWSNLKKNGNHYFDLADDGMKRTKTRPILIFLLWSVQLLVLDSDVNTSEWLQSWFSVTSWSLSSAIDAHSAHWPGWKGIWIPFMHPTVSHLVDPDPQSPLLASSLACWGPKGLLTFYCAVIGSGSVENESVGETRHHEQPETLPPRPPPTCDLTVIWTLKLSEILLGML